MTNPIDDFSRLHTEFPGRNSQRDFRLARRNTGKLFEQIRLEDFEWPEIDHIGDAEKFYLSYLIDRATQKVYNEAIQLMQGTPEHRENYKTLRDAPKNCGGFKERTAILEDSSAFEQMVALDHLIDTKAGNWPKGRRTYCFKQGDDLIPIYVNSTSKMRASTMSTVLGTGSKGRFKVPTYSALANSKEQATSSIFIKPLEGLEIVRQPHFSGATLLKGNAFEADTIDQSHRYQIVDQSGNVSSLACVELKDQNKPRQVPTKERSAGCNILSMKKTSPSKPLAKSLRYEDFSEEGYKDDTKPIKVKDCWRVLEGAIRPKGEEELENLMRQLFVSRVGPFTSPVVKTFYEEKFFN
ncbi:MAG: hypothetical protein K940chlam6_00172 [Chlamydiae bacterium]|nr:hypothetical protein [Chlamydiota bacterium]